MNLPLDNFKQWKAELPAKPEPEQRLDNWLFIHLASVLLSEKTGELLNLPLQEVGVDSASLKTLLSKQAQDWGVDFKILREGESFAKIILYDAQRLQETLDGCPARLLSEKLHYPLPLSAESFLNEIETRWNSTDELPHEIGIALGYPLEDVFGYMGLLPLECKGVCGWQVYGCLQESCRRSCLYQQARSQAIAFLAA